MDELERSTPTKRILLAAVAIGLVSVILFLPLHSVAMPVTVHQSEESFAARPNLHPFNLVTPTGTTVSSCIGEGCPSAQFVVGPDPGPPVDWTVSNLVTYDPDSNQTAFRYTVTNPIPVRDPRFPFISGLVIPTGTQFIPIAADAPPGFDFSISFSNGQLWSFFTTDTNTFRVLPGESATFEVIMLGKIPVIFRDFGLGTGLVRGPVIGNEFWVISAPGQLVPLIPSGALLTLGVALLSLRHVWQERPGRSNGGPRQPTP
jgi:hypothetical protein